MQPITIQPKPLLNLIYDTIKAPVTYWDSRGNTAYTHLSRHTTQTLQLAATLQSIHAKTVESPSIHLTNTSLPIHFLSIPLQEGSSSIGTIIIGPILFSPLQKEELHAYLNESHNNYDHEPFLNIVGSIPIIQQTDLINFGRLVYYLLYAKEVDATDIIEGQLSVPFLNAATQPHIELFKRRQDSHYHHDLLYEKEILHAIKEGNKELFLEKAGTPPSSGHFGILSKKSYLRGRKNLAISFVTLATRAAIEGGLPTELAYTLSDLFIQTIEEITEPHKVDTYRLEAGLQFIEHVSTNRKLNYSRYVNQCLNYIFTHLYENISLSKLATITGTSTVYLSSLFKKEVGMSLSRYIQQERVEEAKKLITLTEHSLSDICVMLNFHDQSYFTKVFKKITGMTPKQYRDRT
ncbi:helix-turn-helix domain-containing protein [Alkalihalobacillus hemicellulosilyticus]|uniref:Helix-turn-helix n=1 Tax=Halalkalibacter hemicellulosilyticusJCM 9152 TaxID=1236971 RepID=W4QAY4_9BACI|nr:helix-turn-helix domain-containing protein [Halalkalibacter hemicellulosilyticus]GAE28833.1 helix-turn-helix [Halalkalibacter hemicellulosilyticusJCM 9152]